MRPQRLSRSLTDRVLGGVCGGLGMAIGVNAWWVRAVFVVLIVFTAGTGALIYLALWFMLPPETLADMPEDVTRLQRRRARPEAMLLVGAGAILMGLIVLARNVGVLSGENGDAFLPIAVMFFGLTLLVKQLWRTA
jgi:phage shock protein PspC (stress-responsive transcriptional regulator)